MAQTPEGKVKTWLSKLLKLQWPNIYIYKAPGTRYGVIGTPDYLCCVEGLFVGIEVKATRDGKPTEKQKEKLIEINTAGGISVVMKGKDYDRFKQIVRAVERALREREGGADANS